MYSSTHYFGFHTFHTPHSLSVPSSVPFHVHHPMPCMCDPTYLKQSTFANCLLSSLIFIQHTFTFPEHCITLLIWSYMNSFPTSIVCILYLLLLLLLLKKVGSARLIESGIHPISPKTPATQYQPIDGRKRKGKRVGQYNTKKNSS